MNEDNQDTPQDISFNQNNQNVAGNQINIAGDAHIDHIGDIYITPAEKPQFFFGVPNFPRYGLIGRDPLLHNLTTRLTTADHVSLSTSGIGGVGKTALAVAVAHHRQLLKHFSDGVLWASVGPEGDPALELGRWANALDINPQDYPEPLALKQAIKNSIAQRRLLLVLDDIWHSDHAELLRCGGPFCAHLLTSRDDNIARRFAGGQENALDVPDLEEDPAFALLNKIASEACKVDEAAARLLVRQVGGLPLAVELLGGYLTAGGAPDPVLFPELSQERLDDLDDPALRLRQAQKRIGDTTGEKKRLSDVMALSLDGFDETEQTTFYALGAFAPKPATFSRAAAEAVSRAGGEFLSQLVNRNLLEIEGGALSIHQILADLARTRMDNQAQARHAAFYLDLVNEDRSDWQRIDEVYEQIRWAWTHVDDDDRLEWIWALRIHQEVRGLWQEKVQWHQRGLVWARTNDHRKYESYFLVNLGWAYRSMGRPAKALRLYQESLPISREVGDRAGEASTLNNMGMVFNATGQPEESLRLYEKALPIRREVEDRAGEARTLNNMGLVYDATGRPEKAQRLYEKALPIMREVGDRAGEAVTLNNMGMVFNATGRPEKAQRLYQEALPITREVGHRAGEAATLNNMAAVYHATGRPAEALRLYQEALPIMREVGDRAGEATTLGNVATLLQQLERIPEAVGRVQEAVALFHSGLTHDSNSNTVEEYEKLLNSLQSGELHQ